MRTKEIQIQYEQSEFNIVIDFGAINKLEAECKKEDQ